MLRRQVWNLLFTFLSVNIPQFALSATLEAFAQVHPTALLIEANTEALRARLAMIDAAQAGYEIKIATMSFDYGKASKSLSRSLCAAARRGVRAELLVDSKSGERLGKDGPNPEIFQLLAQCGVKVYIHNSINNYVTLFGKRVPSIFGSYQQGDSVSLLAAIKTVNNLRDRIGKVVEPVLQRFGQQDSGEEVLSSLQRFGFNTAAFFPVAGIEVSSSGDYLMRPDVVEDGIEKMVRGYRRMIAEPFWRSMNVSRMTQVTAAIKRGLVVDPVLRDARDKVRIFNRLNHRKIFLVKKPGGAGCVIVGGRNVGDPYLTGSAEYKPGDKSFIDGDILVCSHHLPRAQVSFLGAVGSAEDMRAIPEDLLAQVSDSFDNLKVDRFDPYLQQKNVSIRNLQMIRGFRPTEIAADFASGPVPQLKTIEVQGLKLKNFGSPRLLVSSWEPKQDEVQNALLTAIDRETKEIYIETPYAEFNHRLRIALEKALKRGVRVHVVTNGMFISDGPAKVIRLWMAHWNSKMRALHPKLFKIEHATLAYGKLIHFKAAGFRCQKMANGLSRTYIVGSHNFHPRSGYSDKENSLQWFEPAQDNCRAPVRDDLIAERRDYYRQLEKRSPVELLKTYSSLYEELHEVLKSAPKKSDSDFARGIIRALYDYDAESGSYVLWREADLVHILEVVEDSELRDLIGVFF